MKVNKKSIQPSINSLTAGSNTPTITTPETENNNFFLGNDNTPTKFPESSNEIIMNSVVKKVESLIFFLLSKTTNRLMKSKAQDLRCR